LFDVIADETYFFGSLPQMFIGQEYDVAFIHYNKV
jgi:hypothetical protein